MSAAPDDEWLYHLPEFLDRIRETDAHRIRDNLEIDLGGVLYHHRGARVPGYDATFIWNPTEPVFDLEIDTVGPRAAWATFDADRAWDFYLFRAADSAPCLAWMTDTEYRTEEAADFESKQTAVWNGRFSFGLYLEAPAAFSELETRARETDAPCFLHRPTGRTIVPDGDFGRYAALVPPELHPEGGPPPRHLGLVDAQVAYG